MLPYATNLLQGCSWTRAVRRRPSSKSEPPRRLGLVDLGRMSMRESDCLLEATTTRDCVDCRDPPWREGSRPTSDRSGGRRSYAPSDRRRFVLAEIDARYVLRMLTARAATNPTVRNDASDSSSMRLLMRTLSGMASVGLKALAFVNET
jgi:hypothetical protein